MTVASEACYAELVWTGTQGVFSPGFAALNAADVQVQYIDASSVLHTLTRGVHYNSSLDGSGNVTVTPVALPSASIAAPLTLLFARNTTAVQGTDFQNLGTFDKSVYTALFDRCIMLAAELKNKFTRLIQPFVTSSTVVDFRPRTVRAAEPVDNADLATKLYADTVSGSSAAGQAAASAAAAAASATAASGSATSAATSASQAATYYAILAAPDYGLITSPPVGGADYGAIP